MPEDTKFTDGLKSNADKKDIIALYNRIDKYAKEAANRLVGTAFAHRGEQWDVIDTPNLMDFAAQFQGALTEYVRAMLIPQEAYQGVDMLLLSHCNKMESKIKTISQIGSKLADPEVGGSKTTYPFNYIKVGEKITTDLKAIISIEEEKAVERAG